MKKTEIIYHVLAPSVLSINIIHLIGIVIRYSRFCSLHQSQYHCVSTYHKPMFKQVTD
jgi:hypothetical protein